MLVPKKVKYRKWQTGRETKEKLVMRPVVLEYLLVLLV